jgi:hypothetical protein
LTRSGRLSLVCCCCEKENPRPGSTPILKILFRSLTITLRHYKKKKWEGRTIWHLSSDLFERGGCESIKGVVQCVSSVTAGWDFGLHHAHFKACCCLMCFVALDSFHQHPVECHIRNMVICVRIQWRGLQI